MDQVEEYPFAEPSGEPCEEDHDACVVTLGYCPYCQPATFWPGEPVRRHDLETYSPGA